MDREQKHAKAYLVLLAVKKSNRKNMKMDIRGGKRPKR